MKLRSSANVLHVFKIDFQWLSISINSKRCVEIDSAYRCSIDMLSKSILTFQLTLFRSSALSHSIQQRPLTRHVNSLWTITYKSVNYFKQFYYIYVHWHFAFNWIKILSGFKVLLPNQSLLPEFQFQYIRYYYVQRISQRCKLSNKIYCNITLRANCVLCQYKSCNWFVTLRKKVHIVLPCNFRHQRVSFRSFQMHLSHIIPC